MTTDQTPQSGQETPEQSDQVDHVARHHFYQEWHVALNKHNAGGDNFKHWMYEAKKLCQEVPRLKRLFREERLGKLKKLHKQCSHAATVPVEDNHLKCCLGVECRKCPELLALEQADVSPEQLDEIKAWTCAGHIVFQGGDHAGEGYILTTDDRMFWSNVYSSLAAGGV